MLLLLLWTAYLAVLIFLTYDLIICSISRIARGLLDTDFLHLIIVSLMWAWLIVYFFIKKP